VERPTCPRADSLGPPGHAIDSHLQRRGLLGAEQLPDLLMGRLGVFHLVTRWEELDPRLDTKRVRDDVREVEHGVRLIGADVEGFADGFRTESRPSDHRRYIANVRERAGLAPVSEDRHGLPGHDLIHEDAHYVAIPVSNVLVLAVDIVRAED